jgi:chromosomal replication initiation ATPase DnaA
LHRITEHAVTSVFALPRTALATESRGPAEIAFARQVAMYLAHIAGGHSLSAVGRMFGRDRTTVAHACGLVEDRRDDPSFDRAIEALEGAVRGTLRGRTGIPRVLGAAAR